MITPLKAGGQCRMQKCIKPPYLCKYLSVPKWPTMTAYVKADIRSFLITYRRAPLLSKEHHRVNVFCGRLHSEAVHFLLHQVYPQRRHVQPKPPMTPDFLFSWSHAPWWHGLWTFFKEMKNNVNIFLNILSTTNIKYCLSISYFYNYALNVDLKQMEWEL